FRPVHARTLRANERPFQVQAKNAIATSQRTCGCYGAAHMVARVRDQSGQAGGGAEAAVCPGNRAHTVSSRPIVEQNATAAIPLQVHKASRHETPCRNARLLPIRWNLARRSEAGDAAIPDHHGSAAMPAAAVKNTVRNDGAPFAVLLVLAHIFPR